MGYKKKTGLISLVIIFCLVLLVSSPAKVEEQEKMLYPTWDCHLHYLDFTQKTDGFEKLIEAMDSAGVESAIIFGMPIVKMWSESDPVRPDYYLDTDSHAYYYSATDFILAQELLAQDDLVQKRFYPFISGINPLDKNAADYIEILLNLYPGFWKGIGELMSRHDDLTAFTCGEPPRADHPALMKVYELAAEYELPVLIHHNISSANRREPIYLPELERALESNPATTFIWAHAGISRRVEVPTLTEQIDEVLKKYPNLYVDLSWVVFEDYIIHDELSLKRWVKLIENHPDRFMIGSDKVGHWNGYIGEMTKYNVLLEQLSEQAARNISKENIKRLVDPDAKIEKQIIEKVFH